MDSFSVGKNVGDKKMRSFIAIDIEDNLKSKIVDIQNNIGSKYLKIKFVEPENLHFTLKFLGEIEEKNIEDIYKILQKNLENYKPFEIDLKGLGAFPSFSYIRVLWIGIQDESNSLINIADGLNMDLRNLGFKKEKKLIPHLTIGRVKFVKDKEKILQILKELQNVKIGKMMVDRILIKKSVLTPKGPIYSDLKEVRL